MDPVRAGGAARVCRYEMVPSLAMGVMTRGPSDVSRHDAVLTLCDRAEELVRSGGDRLRLPQLIATRGSCLAAAGRPDLAEDTSRASVEIASSHGFSHEVARELGR
jgi:hypothetical protein